MLSCSSFGLPMHARLLRLFVTQFQIAYTCPTTTSLCHTQRSKENWAKTYVPDAYHLFCPHSYMSLISEQQIDKHMLRYQATALAEPCSL